MFQVLPQWNRSSLIEENFQQAVRGFSKAPHVQEQTQWTVRELRETTPESPQRLRRLEGFQTVREWECELRETQVLRSRHWDVARRRYRLSKARLVHDFMYDRIKNKP
jgi:acyl carrier protein phosphodiesterase